MSQARDAVNDWLPEGWATTSLLDLCQLIRGVSYKKGEASAILGDGLIPLVRANNIDGELHFDDLQYVPEIRIGKEQLLSVGDVVVAMSSGSKKVVGKAACLRSSWHGAFGAFCGVLRPSPQLEAGFFGYYFQMREYRDYISGVSAGTNINNLKREYFANIGFPLPPLAEQKRIVAMVEKLLSRVNAARERLAKVPAILKRFRQSVLAAACSGRLTADWHAAYPNIEPASKVLARICRDRGLLPQQALAPLGDDVERPDGWAATTLGFLAEPTLKGRPYVTSGSRGWAKYVSDRGPFFIRSENINTEYLRLDSAVRVAAPPGAEADRTRVCPDDLLLTITGNNVGRTAVVPVNCPPAHVSQHVAIIRTSPRCYVPYLWLWVRSEKHGQAQLRSHFYGETKPGLNMDQVKGVWVYFPPIDEQNEIVRRVEALFKLADTIEQRVQAGTQRADRLTQAVLAKAFRGELVPTEAELARREGRDLPAPHPGVWFVYAIRCDDDSLYIGQTEDLAKRWEEHLAGRGSDWTRRHRPLHVAHYEAVDSRENAVEREKWLKTGFGRKWLKREIAAGRARQAGYEPASALLARIKTEREAATTKEGTRRQSSRKVRR